MRLLNLNLDFRFVKRRRFYKMPVAKRYEIFVNKIKELRPEIITLQEITDTWAVYQLKKRLSPLNYDHIYKGVIKLSGGVVTWYDFSRWHFVKSEFVAFTDQGKFFSRQLADRILRKGILSSILEDRESGQVIQVINLHLTANYGQKLKDEERQILKIQLEELARLLEKQKNKTTWQIVAGDFNADFNASVIQKWLEDNGLKAAFPGRLCTVCPTQNPLCHRDQNDDFQIDNVLCRDCQKISGELIFNREGEYLSDHYGQLIEIEF